MTSLSWSRWRATDRCASKAQRCLLCWDGPARLLNKRATEDWLTLCWRARRFGRSVHPFFCARGQINGLKSFLPSNVHNSAARSVFQFQCDRRRSTNLSWPQSRVSRSDLSPSLRKPLIAIESLPRRSLTMRRVNRSQSPSRLWEPPTRSSYEFLISNDLMAGASYQRIRALARLNSALNRNSAMIVIAALRDEPVVRRGYKPIVERNPIPATSVCTSPSMTKRTGDLPLRVLRK